MPSPHLLVAFSPSQTHAPSPPYPLPRPKAFLPLRTRSPIHSISTKRAPPQMPLRQCTRLPTASNPQPPHIPNATPPLREPSNNDNVVSLDLRSRVPEASALLEECGIVVKTQSLMDNVARLSAIESRFLCWEKTFTSLVSLSKSCVTHWNLSKSIVQLSRD